MSMVDECLSLPAPYTTPSSASRSRFHHVPRVAKRERKPRPVVIAEKNSAPVEVARPRARPAEVVNRTIGNVVML